MENCMLLYHRNCHKLVKILLRLVCKFSKKKKKNAYKSASLFITRILSFSPYKYLTNNGVAIAVITVQ